MCDQGNSGLRYQPLIIHGQQLTFLGLHRISHPEEIGAHLVFSNICIKRKNGVYSLIGFANVGMSSMVSNLFELILKPELIIMLLMFCMHAVYCVSNQVFAESSNINAFQQAAKELKYEMCGTECTVAYARLPISLLFEQEKTETFSHCICV